MKELVMEVLKDIGIEIVGVIGKHLVDASQKATSPGVQEK